MEKFVQKVNLKLVKKGRKYWTVIQHWKGRGGIERDYEVKMAIDDSNKNLEQGTELTDYLVEVQKEVSRYGTKRLLVPICSEKYNEDRSESIYNAFKNKWGDEDFIPSPSDVSYAEDQRAELKKLNVTKYDEEIVKLMHSAVARRNIKFIREQFADDMFINEKRIDNLHQLGCFDYDDEIAEMRRKKEEAQNAELESREAEREAERAKRKQWLAEHFTRTIPVEDESKPKIGSLTVIVLSQTDGTPVYRAGRCTSSRFVSDEDNVWSYGDIYYAEYDDISSTDEGKEAIAKYKAQKEAEKQARLKTVKRGKALRKLENWIKEHNQLSEGERVNLNLSDLKMIYDDRSIYGGGESIAVDQGKKQIWYLINHHADGDNWSANNIYFNTDSADGDGDAIGFMASSSSDECVQLVDEFVQLQKH